MNEKKNHHQISINKSNKKKMDIRNENAKKKSKANLDSNLSQRKSTFLQKIHQMAHKTSENISQEHQAV